MNQKGPYAVNDNGSAKDPEAFREALRADPQRIAALQVADDSVSTEQTLKR